MDYLFTQKYQDLELFVSEARAWDLDFIQLERGAPEYELTMAGVGEVQIGHARFNRKIFQRGAAPVGMRTIAIPMDPAMELQWYGQEVRGNDLMVFPNDGELISLSLPQFEVIVYSLSEARLELVCEELELPSFGQLLGSASVFRLPMSMMRMLRREVSALVHVLKSGAQVAAANAIFLEQLEYGFARTVIGALAYSKLKGRGAIAQKRKRTACVKTVLEVIDGAGNIPKISELCQIAHVSERTLQYAFREEFGLSPKQFIQAWRLNAVRRDLNMLEEKQSISAVASRYGYWHMGQFAADYRKMFGELPSVTAARVCF